MDETPHQASYLCVETGKGTDLPSDPRIAVKYNTVAIRLVNVRIELSP